MDADYDFTIARRFSDKQVLRAIRRYFERVPSGEIEVDRAAINAGMPEDSQLSKTDAECLFTGLVLNGAATQSEQGRTFADYKFTVDVNFAVEIIKIQTLARSALDEIGVFDVESQASTIELTGTFPPGVTVNAFTGVRQLSDDLRQMFFDADSTVRIANPYFDPTSSVVGDLASIANRGVKTKILTRETKDADPKLRRALNTMYEDVKPANRRYVEVRDLFKQDSDTGRQAYATHAKITIADEDLCYLGSANLTDTSLSDNFELGVLLRGEIVLTATAVFDAVFEISKSVNLPL